MYYVQHGSRPAGSATPSTGARMAASTPRSCSASRASPVGARCSTTWRRRPRRTGSSRSARSSLEARRRARPSPPPRRRPGAVEPQGDVDHRARAAVLQQRRRLRASSARPRRCPRTRFYRNGVADEMLFVHEGTGVCDTIFGPLRYGPGDYLVLPIGTTWRLDPDAGSAQRMLYLECAVGDRAAEALPQRLRPAPRALAVLAARPPRPGRRPAARRDTASSSSHVRSTDRLTAYHYRQPPVRRRRLGRLPVAVPVQHRRLPADHRVASTSRRRSTRRSRPATSWSARSCPASSTTTRSRSRRRTTTRTSTATRSSTTWPATS